MIANNNSQYDSTNFHGNSLIKSLAISSILFIVLIFFSPATRFNFGINLWFTFLGGLLIFVFYETQERELLEKHFFKGYYPPEYIFYKSFLIVMVILYFFVLGLYRDVLTQIIFTFIVAIIASMISLIPYLRTQGKNQTIQLSIQKNQLVALSKRIDDFINQPESLKEKKPNFDAKTGKPLVDTTVLDKQQQPQSRFDTQTGKPLAETLTQDNQQRQVRFDSQTGKPLAQTSQPEVESTTTLRTKTPQTDDEVLRRVKQISREEYEAKMNLSDLSTSTESRQPLGEVPLQRTTRVEPTITREPQRSTFVPLSTKIIENIRENFAGYLFFGSIIFLFIAGLAWILVFFPSTGNITIGTQTWIAGDTVVIFGLLIILLSEFILGKSKYSDFIPINYLGIGVGLGISLLGLLSIRFDVLSVFLTDTGLIDKNWLFFMLSILVASLSWIYAWRSPYRDLIFGSLISGFILVDYSLQFQFSILVVAGVIIGLIFIFLPGLEASFVESKDNRFFLGGLIVYALLLLKIENVQALIKIEPLIYALALLLPVFCFVFLFTLKKINTFYLVLCFPASAFMLVINELSYINSYISSEIFSLVFIGILLLYFFPKIVFRHHNLYTILILGLNALAISGHVLLGSIQWISPASWFIIVVPVAINFFILLFDIRSGTIKSEYLLILYISTILTLGLHLDTIGLVLLVLLLGLILTLVVLLKNESLFIQTSFLASSLVVVTLGSYFAVFEPWELVSIPFIIPILFVFLLIYKGLSKELLKPVIVVTMVTMSILTFTQSIFANYIVVEYFIIMFLVGLAFIFEKHKQESDLYYWFLLYIGFIGTFAYADYDLVLAYSSFILLSVQSFIILLLYVSELSQKRVKQLVYDAANVTLFTSLFALVILEQFNNQYFLLTLGIFLLANVFIVWYLLRYSGMDFTVAILLPALLVIGKELYVTQYLVQEIDPLYSLIEFSLVAVSGFCLALLSRRITEYDALISPTISAMFSIELVLIVLFINKVIVDYNALGTFLVLLSIITIANFVQKPAIQHVEYLLIILSSILLAIVLPITQTMDKMYLYVLLASVPVFWFILRFKVKKLFFIPDSIVFVALVSGEYIISLQLPNDTFIQAGLLTQQVIILLTIVSFILQFKHLSVQDRFKTLLLIQLPFWLSVFIFYDLASSGHVLYSSFTDFRPLTDLALLKISLLVLFVIVFVIYLGNNFETTTSLINVLVIGVISYITLGLLIVQSIISQFIADPVINGLILTGITILLMIFGALLVKRDSQVQTSNHIVLVGSFYTILTIAVFLLDNGLISGILAILGTALIILGLSEKFRKELTLVGAFYLLFSMSKIVFDILNNFNVLVFEIAISSSILAICLLLLGMIANYKMNRSSSSETQTN